VKEYYLNRHRPLIESLGYIENKTTNARLFKPYNCVKVFGYNSGKFDDNLIFDDLNKVGKIKKIIGGSTKYKAVNVIVSENLYIQFCDTMHYTAGGSLENFAKNFGGATNLKGTFPYEAVRFDNYNEVLSGSEPLPKETFFSTIKNSGISDEEYKDYVNNLKQMNSHWDNLKKYNEQDTQIMIPSNR